MDSSKISRWETARLRVPYLAIRRYEELLELSLTHLTSIVDTLYWYVSPTGDGANELHSRRPTGHANPRRRVDELVEQMCSRQLVTGSEWEELTVLLAAMPRELTLPQEIWTPLAERLISETIISDRVWFPRFASFNRLLAHPLVVRGAVSRRTRFPIPLSIRTCGFPAYGLPMIFSTWLRHPRITDSP
ncbi:MAG TPA: hypothetical protein VHX38_23835, partial [Pseudonocardiaceae bacterium]|nr:hypothetical protein [Pseudonocardiaceae bacterium]